MINDVRNALNSIVGSVTILHDAAGAGGIFELYVMTGVARGRRYRLGAETKLASELQAKVDSPVFLLIEHSSWQPFTYVDGSYRVIDAQKLPFCSREEFRTPLGVGKSPRNEPAVCKARLMGI